MTNWTLARRTRLMDPGITQKLLKLTESPDIISLAGGLPAMQTFPVEAMAEACQRVFETNGADALQYSAGEGYAPLREWVCAELQKQHIRASADQIIITTGSQQALDLVAKVMVDAGSRVLAEKPTYMAGIQAFSPCEPEVVGIASDEQGPLPQDVAAKIGTGNDRARFMYTIPNFQNPSGRTMSKTRREALAEELVKLGLPFVEDNPYGDVWFEEPPPAALTSHASGQGIYLGSFSKVLAPGLRLGYMVAPRAIYDKLMYVKLASDLHTPSLNQRLVYEIIKDGFLDTHIPKIRELYRNKRDAMLAALDREMAGLGVTWTRPAGGMFLWLDLPKQVDTLTMFPKAIEHKVAYVPGAAFYASDPESNHMRLCYVTASIEQINTAIAALATTIKDELAKA